jgi:hypothetical protein
MEKSKWVLKLYNASLWQIENGYAARLHDMKYEFSHGQI